MNLAHLYEGVQAGEGVLQIPIFIPAYMTGPFQVPFLSKGMITITPTMSHKTHTAVINQPAVFEGTATTQTVPVVVRSWPAPCC